MSRVQRGKGLARDLQMVRKNPLLLKNIKNHNYIICSIAVKKNGMAAQFLKIHKFSSDEINQLYSDSVEQNGLALQFIKEKHQTHDLCLKAIMQNGLAIKYVKDKTYELEMEAVNQNGLAIKYVRNQTESLILKAVKQNGMALKFIEQQTVDLCIKAIAQNIDAVQFAKIDLTNDVYLMILRKNGLFFNKVEEEQTVDMIMAACKQLDFKCQFEYSMANDRYKLVCI